MNWLQNMDSEFTDHVALQLTIFFSLLLFHILFRSNLQSMSTTFSCPLLILLQPILDLIVCKNGRLIWHWSCILWYQISKFFWNCFASCLIIRLILSVSWWLKSLFLTLLVLLLSFISIINNKKSISMLLQNIQKNQTLPFDHIVCTLRFYLNLRQQIWNLSIYWIHKNIHLRVNYLPLIWLLIIWFILISISVLLLLIGCILDVTRIVGGLFF